MKPKIIFFNQGDHLTPVFKPQGDRANFFWFHDSFYSHVSIAKQDRFLHLFVRDVDAVNFEFMQGNNTWQDVLDYYRANKQKLEQSYASGNLNPVGSNPPILRSYDALVPDLIFDFGTEGANNATVIYPSKFRTIQCEFFNTRHVPIPYMQIPELVKLLALEPQ